MRIVIDPIVENYLGELIEILYNQNYFGFKENAYKYVDSLIDEITLNIDILPKKNAPIYFNRYGEGMRYITIRKNKQTHWYVFFHYEDDIYYVRYIANNHNIAQYL